MALTDNLVSYWKLDESSGNAADSVGGITYTNYNGASYGTGKINNGVVTTSSQYLKGNAYTPGTSDFSYSIWFKTTSTASAVRIMGSAASGTRNFVEINLGTGGKITAEIAWVYSGNNEGLTTALSSGAYIDGNWHHLVAVFNNPSSRATITVYVDGSQILTAVHASLSYNISSLVYGAIATSIYWPDGTANTSSFIGTIDEVGIWSRALTSTEVSQLYNNGNGLQYPFTVANTTNFFQFF